MNQLQSSVWNSRSEIRILRFLCTFVGCVLAVIPATAQQIASSDPPGNKITTSIAAVDPQPGDISGTVFDVNDDIVPGATVTLEDPDSAQLRSVVANNNGAFEFNDVNPGVTYHLTIRADGFATWASPTVIVNPGQFVLVTNAKLKLVGGVASVTVYASSDEIATEQVRIEEKQRVLGFIPNFYVTYDHDPAPLTTKLKFGLALKSSIDPITFLEAAALAGMNQAGDRPDYVQGAKGYGQRLGSAYTGIFVNYMIGGAILPSLLHQDPRYFYQGSGTTKSRVRHALSYPFICKGDNGRWQPNYSSIGGDLATGAISNIYYPASNRGPGLVFTNTLISMGGDMVNGLIQEFILRRLTPSARHRK
jgi:uncharacterized protein (DUF2249 family)